MRSLTDIDLMQAYCKSAKTWGMFISMSFDPDKDADWPDVAKTVPYLNFQDHMQIFADMKAFLFFDTEEEMRNTYDMTVGDDGPTRLNAYNGLARTYALTCSPSGQLLNENT